MSRNMLLVVETGHVVQYMLDIAEEGSANRAKDHYR
jgi:hypothetical protein